jgi:hypothetical protein
VEHDVLSATMSRAGEAIGATRDAKFGIGPLGRREKAPFMLAANGSLVELASGDGRFRHEVFVPEGKLTDILLASNVFPVMRTLARIIVLESRPLVDGQLQDPPRMWVTQGSL